MTLTELCLAAFEDAKAKGWHEKPATFGDRIALIHSELSEALEAFRDADNGYSVSGLEEMYKRADGTITRDVSHWETEDGVWGPGGVGVNWTEVLHKPVGVPSELADAVIRIADLCGLYGIDLEKAVKEKLSFNRTRPFRHGGKRL